MNTDYQIGQKIMVSPLLTHYNYWEEGVIINIEDSTFNGIVLTTKMPNGDVFFQRADPEYFSDNIEPFFVTPCIEDDEDAVHYCYDLDTTLTIKSISEIIACLPIYYCEGEMGDDGNLYRNYLYEYLLQQKETLKSIVSKQIIHGETQYDLEKQAMYIIKNKITDILYHIEADLQIELGLMKLKKDSSSFVKGMDFIAPGIYISHMLCPHFAVEYTMYLGETAEGKEILCTLLLHFKCDNDESSSIFYYLNSGLLICENYAKSLDSKITYEQLKSYIKELLLNQQSSPNTSIIYKGMSDSYEDDEEIFASIGNEVYYVMIKCDNMIRDEKYQLFKPMPLLKLQDLMNKSYCCAKYAYIENNDKYNTLIKENQQREKRELKNSLIKITKQLLYTLVDPYDYADLIIEQSQIKRKLKQIEDSQKNAGGTV